MLVADLDALGDQAPPEAELQRIVAPLGKCIVRRAGKWSESTQPLPAEMDTWTHWDHGPDGNPVSRDGLVRPPTSLRWQAGPVRGMHDALAGVRLHAGRVFYSSEDEDSPHRSVEGRRTLYCRDAFNGLLLWKRPVAGLRNRFAFVPIAGRSTRSWKTAGRLRHSTYRLAKHACDTWTEQPFRRRRRGSTSGGVWRAGWNFRCRPLT